MSFSSDRGSKGEKKHDNILANLDGSGKLHRQSVLWYFQLSTAQNKQILTADDNIGSFANYDNCTRETTIHKKGLFHTVGNVNLFGHIIQCVLNWTAASATKRKHMKKKKWKEKGKTNKHQQQSVHSKLF